MAINYGTSIHSPRLSVGQADVGIRQQEDSGVDILGLKQFSKSASKLGRQIASYVRKPAELAFGKGPTLASVITAIPSLPGDLAAALHSTITGGEGDATRFGHSALQIGALIAPYLVPGAGPILSASLFASETAWNTVDLAQSGNGSAQDYTLMWAAAGTALLTSVKSVGRLAAKPFKNSAQVKRVINAKSGFTNQELIESHYADLARIKPGTVSQEAAYNQFKIKKAFAVQQQDFFKKGVGRNFFKSPQSRVGAGLKSAAGASEQFGVLGKSDLNNFFKRRGAEAVKHVELQYNQGLAEAAVNRQSSARESVKSILSAYELEVLDDLLLNREGGTLASRTLFQLNRFYRRLSIATRIALRGSGKRLFGRAASGTSLLAEYGGIPRNTFQLIKSSRFYSREVQIIQNFNGQDGGRWLAENGYSFVRHGAKSRWGKNLTKKWWKGRGTEEAEATWWQGLDHFLEERGFSKTLGKLHGIDKLKDNYVASGGVLFPRNRYILGYKEISKTGVGPTRSYRLLVSFYPYATNEKAPIMINASAYDVEQLLATGTKYWFKVGQAKGWFMSRGGRSKIANGGSTAGFISMLLTILPVQAIRTLGSILHNIKDVKGNLSENGFVGGLTNYWEEATHAFKTTSLNRVGRTFTAGVIGAKYGRWAGRFAQQIGTGVINAATVSKYTKTGKLKRAFKEGGGGRLGIFKKKLIGTNRSSWDTSIIGTRISSDLRRGIHKQSGVTYAPTKYKRKTSIYGSVVGKGTKKSTGWFGGW